MKITNKLVALAAAMTLFAASALGCTSSPAQSGAASSAAASSQAASSAAISSEPAASEPAADTTVRVTVLKGPTGLGALKLMDDAAADKTPAKYEFELATAPDQVTASIASGEIDVAAVPTNLAATLYNKTEGKVQLAALNTLGVLSLLTNGEAISSVDDLKGKTIYASGQGSTTEYAINYILAQSGLEVGKDVQVEYKSEHAELATALISGEAKIAVLPEPFVTQVMTKNSGIKLALDLTKEWDQASSGKSVLAMGCMVVRSEFASQNKAAFDAFLDQYKASIEYVNANLDEAAALSEKYDIMPSAVAKKAIPNCNIVYMDGADMKAKIPDFLNVLFEANPKSIGGKLPSDDFYYEK